MDEIVAFVPVDAVARVEKVGMPITVHSQQTGPGQLVGHLDGVLVGSGRVIGVPYDQHRISSPPVPGAKVAVSIGGLPCGARLVRPRGVGAGAA